MDKKKMFMGCGLVVGAILLLCIGFAIYGAGVYNSMITLEEQVNEKWSQVENVYQRRLDLIPNLVATVKGYAAHEKETLTAVTEARSKAAGSVKLTPEMLSNPQAMAQFQQVQGSLSSALSKLMVVIEKYPDLKANENFLNLQNQLEGTENRITVERMRFNKAAKEFNIIIKKFPKNIIAGFFGFKSKEYFKADTKAKEAPKVQF